MGPAYQNPTRKTTDPRDKAARTIVSLRYEDANHCQIISQYGWLNVEHLIYYDLGVFMYKTMNGLSPAIGSFQNVKDIHQYQTRSATKGNLYISNVNTSRLEGYLCCWLALVML